MKYDAVYRKLRDQNDIIGDIINVVGFDTYGDVVCDIWIELEEETEEKIGEIRHYEI